jgi:glycosyltransferase involved in cell wall biosynthesis
MNYLERVLGALRGQSFPLARWELLLIDNKSEEPLFGRVDLSWHPQTRVVREEELGLTRARLRGIAGARGKLLVFVDDDNILRSDYLEQALKISMEWPKLGAWSGRVVPEYEVIPSRELEPYIWMLCIRPIEKDSWGNEGSFDSTPWGAGMCVRKGVAVRYAVEIENDNLRASLDRKGADLGSTGDIDLALTSPALGLGTGVFKILEISHLIPSRRVQESYLLKLIEDTEAGSAAYNLSRGLKKPAKKPFVDRLVEEYKFLRASKLQRKIELAIRRGKIKGKSYLNSLKK